MAKTTVKPVKHIPDGYSPVTPYLTVKDAAKAIDFYKQAFGAEERMRVNTPDGKVMHAEIAINGAVVMLHDEMQDWKALSPKTIGDSGSSVLIYVKDVDAVIARAVKAGATLVMEAADQFYGDRCGNIVDPSGHKWAIATHIEDVSPDDMKRRSQEFFAKQKKS